MENWSNRFCIGPEPTPTRSVARGMTAWPLPFIGSAKADVTVSAVEVPASTAAVISIQDVRMRLLLVHPAKRATAKGARRRQGFGKVAARPGADRGGGGWRGRSLASRKEPRHEAVYVRRVVGGAQGPWWSGGWPREQAAGR